MKGVNHSIYKASHNQTYNLVRGQIEFLPRINIHAHEIYNVLDAVWLTVDGLLTP